MDEKEIHDLLGEHGLMVASSQHATRSHLLTSSAYSVGGMGAAVLCGKKPTYNWKRHTFKTCDLCLAEAVRRGYLTQGETNA